MLYSIRTHSVIFGQYIFVIGIRILMKLKLIQMGYV